jgi:hypothetical protein
MFLHRTLLCASLGVLCIDARAEYWAAPSGVAGTELLLLDTSIPKFVNTTYHAFWHTWVDNGEATNQDPERKRSFFFYGGVAYNDGEKPDAARPTGLIWSCWPVGPTGENQVPIYQAPGLGSTNAVGEGASASIGGQHPFKAGRWYRQMLRVWKPSDPAAAKARSYLGRWMKDLDSGGEWVLQGIFELPFPAARFSADAPLGGFVEKFGPGEGLRSQSFRNLYSYKEGRWIPAHTIYGVARGPEHQGNLFDEKTQTYTYRFDFKPFEGSTERKAPEVEKVELKQPAQPTLAPLKLGHLRALRKGRDLVVEWQTAAGSAPQLRARITVEVNGEPPLTRRIDLPFETRALFSLPGDPAAAATVKLTLTDPFDRSMSGETIASTELPADRVFAAKSSARTRQGLLMEVFQWPDAVADIPHDRDWANWADAPDWSRAEPVLRHFQGTLNLQLLPRDFGIGVRTRALLRAPESGLYRLQLVATDGGELKLSGRTVLRQEQRHSKTPVETWLWLEKGAHPAELSMARDARNANNGPALALSWQRPGGTMEPVPAACWSLPPDAPGAETQAKVVAEVGQGARSNQVTFTLADPAALDPAVASVEVVTPSGEIWARLSPDNPARTLMMPEARHDLITRTVRRDHTRLDGEAFALETRNPEARGWQLAPTPRPVARRPLGHSITPEKVVLIGDEERWAYREVTGDFTFQMRVLEMENLLGPNTNTSLASFGFRAQATPDRQGPHFLWHADPYFRGRFQVPGDGSNGLRDRAWRESAHAPAPPCEFRFQRRGKRFQAWFRNEGQDEWTRLWDLETEMPETLCIGPMTNQSVHLPASEFYRITFDRIRIEQP